MHLRIYLYLGLSAALIVGCRTPSDSGSGGVLSLDIVEPFEDTAPPRQYDVRILRDEWGVPHIFGKTDPDASFGLAYAHCEDDFGTIQDTLLTVRAESGAVNGAQAAQMDYMVHLLGIWDLVEEKYETELSPEARALCEAYAAGANLYAEKHPEEMKMRGLFPISGKDIVAGFAFRSPFFFGLDRALLELFATERKYDVSAKRASASIGSYEHAVSATSEFFFDGLPTGSNTFSVSPRRSADGATYLNVNAHQPWVGPVAWYEAHVHSEEGWDFVGGTFPGSPVILHGHNRHLGWAHTVNSPDLVDIYVLKMNPDNPDQYLFDGEWKDLEVGRVQIRVRVNEDSPMTMPVNREILRSVHGPVMRTNHGVYAIRYAGMGEIRQVEQWYRMNKATSMEEWLDSMRMRSVASLNAGYADEAGNILYLYNALLPKRHEGYDWSKYLPGDTSETLWTDYVPFDALPLVVNPPSGFIQNCNSTPFRTTDGPGNPSVLDFSRTFGIETHMTNRALRAMELFSADKSITEEDFYRYKFDMKYSDESFVGRAVRAMLDAPEPEDVFLQQALEVLTRWDLGTDPDNRHAALGMLTIRPSSNSRGEPDVNALMERLGQSADTLMRSYGRLNIPWKYVNRLRRGDLDIGLGGGPDILHAVYGRPTEDGAQLVGRAGDSYILIVRWDPNGSVSSKSIHQYGSATLVETSPHFADQAPLFAERKMKPVWFDEEDIRQHLEREYRPGEEDQGS